MADAKQTLIFWGTVEFSRGFDFTFGPGIVPSCCNIYTLPEGLTGDLPNVADLTFYQLDEFGAPLTTFTFPDCLLESPRMIFNPSGNTLTLPILDRRWKWRYGSIDGSYNVPEPDGISIKREKTPHELATLLLDAMQETGYDITRLPNDDRSRPHVEWSAALPAAELDSLCQQLGCIVVLDAATNTVIIWPEGHGLNSPPLPTDYPISGLGQQPVYPAQPHDIRVLATNTLFQATFKCEAVGLDTDNRWKLIDDLSIKPATGWGIGWPPAGWAWITGTYSDGSRTLDKRDLANRYVYRAYRITGLADGGWSPPLLAGTDLQPATMKDLRFFNTLADYWLDEDGDGGIRPLEAVAYAKRFRDGTEQLKPTSDPLKYPHGVYFDTVHGIIIFPEPVFQVESGVITPAEVRFECSFFAGKDGVFHRHKGFGVDRGTGSTIPTPIKVIQRPEIQRTVIYRYNNSDTLGSTDDNQSDCNNRLFYWEQSELASYGPQSGGSASYTYLVPLSPDGLIQQVTWSGGLDGAQTVASAAQRHNRYVPALDNQRHGVRIPQVENKLAAIDKALKTTADIERMTVV